MRVAAAQTSPVWGDPDATAEVVIDWVGRRREQLVVADIDAERVRGERQNFDPAGHYFRGDVIQVTVALTEQFLNHARLGRAVSAGNCQRTRLRRVRWHRSRLESATFHDQ